MQSPIVKATKDSKESIKVNSNRRRILRYAATLTAASLAGGASGVGASEPPPEIRRIKLNAFPVTCMAPIYVAEALLQQEGFTEVIYLPGAYEVSVGPGEQDADLDFLPACPILIALDEGRAIVALAGMHLGCYELFGTGRIKAIRDLRGKFVPVDGIGGAQHALLSSMAAYVGLNPRTDINWIISPPREGVKLFINGRADAYLAYPPEPFELRAAGIGFVIVNTATDKPWSQYHCCMLVTHPDFVRKYPVAAKRALRAVLKAADLCATQPELAARRVVEMKASDREDYAARSIREIRFDAWRSYDPEDALRFHALRLHDVGLIKTAPNKLIERGTDWRFVNELKRELRI